MGDFSDLGLEVLEQVTGREHPSLAARRSAQAPQEIEREGSVSLLIEAPRNLGAAGANARLVVFAQERQTLLLARLALTPRPPAPPIPLL